MPYIVSVNPLSGSLFPLEYYATIKVNYNDHEGDTMEQEVQASGKIAVIIEDIINVNGREVKSNQKVYLFNSAEAAEKFYYKIQDVPRSENSDNEISVSINDFVVEASDDAEPVFLHTAYYDHREVPEDNVRVLEDVDVLTVEEIEAFRAAGIKQSIVKAYDERNSLEPAISEVEPENGSVSRFDMLGLNIFQDDPKTEYFLSFDPEISVTLMDKFGDVEVEEASKPAKVQVYSDGSTSEEWDNARFAARDFIDTRGREEWITRNEFLSYVVKTTGLSRQNAIFLLEEFEESGAVVSVLGKGLRHPAAAFLELKQDELPEHNDTEARVSDVQRRQDFLGFVSYLKEEVTE